MTSCIDTPTAEPPTSVPNIEARLGRIENTLDRIETFLELTRSRTPPEKKHWLNAEMERRKCISWELLADDLKFKTLFLTPRHFHNIATELAELKGWRSEKIDKNRYYYAPTFDIEALRSRAQWRNYHPNDPKFNEYLVKQVILKKGTVNLLDFLRNDYPNRGDPWHNDVIDFTAGYIRKEGYKIDRDGDIFTKREG
jgi:hypothetical protein